MRPPDFLTLEEVIHIHADQIERYGGSPGIRDMGLLQSAVAMPKSGVRDRYLHGDLFDMAAAYLFHIVQNHPFVDGNKRTGAMAAYTFLKLNGLSVTAKGSDLERLVLSVAQGKIGKGAVGEFFRRNVRRALKRRK